MLQKYHHKGQAVVGATGMTRLNNKFTTIVPLDKDYRFNVNGLKCALNAVLMRTFLKMKLIGE